MTARRIACVRDSSRGSHFDSGGSHGQSHDAAGEPKSANIAGFPQRLYKWSVPADNAQRRTRSRSGRRCFLTCVCRSITRSRAPIVTT